MKPLLSILAAFRDGSTRRATARSLRSLSAAQLMDIGIDPGSIDEVVETMLSADVHRSAPVPRPLAATAREPLALAHGS